jgi:hypothetical protein
MVASHYELTNDPAQAKTRSDLAKALEEAFRIARHVEDPTQREALIKDISDAQKSYKNTQGGFVSCRANWVNEDSFNREKKNMEASVGDALRIAQQIAEPVKRELLVMDLADVRTNIGQMTWNAVLRPSFH